MEQRTFCLKTYGRDDDFGNLVEKITDADKKDLLNQAIRILIAEGWEVMQIIPTVQRFIKVMDGDLGYVYVAEYQFLCKKQ